MMQHNILRMLFCVWIVGVLVGGILASYGQIRWREATIIAMVTTLVTIPPAAWLDKGEW